MKSINVKTKSREELVDVTGQVRRAVRESGVREGLAVLYVPHTTAAVTVNEGADPDVALDIIAGLSSAAPRNARWRHMEGNADAHVKSSLISPTTHLIVENGDLVLGTWQKIFFCEFDGPRSRRMYVKVIEG